jgi:hypothetical protein
VEHDNGSTYRILIHCERLLEPAKIRYRTLLTDPIRCPRIKLTIPLEGEMSVEGRSVDLLVVMQQ